LYAGYGPFTTKSLTFINLFDHQAKPDKTVSCNFLRYHPKFPPHSGNQYATSRREDLRPFHHPALLCEKLNLKTEVEIDISVLVRVPALVAPRSPVNISPCFSGREGRLPRRPETMKELHKTPHSNL